MAPPHYRFRLHRLDDDSFLGDLPLKGVTYGYKLNGIGEFRGSFYIGEDQTRVDLANVTPTETVIYVERNGIEVWGGIIWTKRYSSEGRSVDIGASDWMSYFQHRYIADDIATDSLEFVGQDVSDIATDIITYAQAKPNGNILVQTFDLGLGTSYITDKFYDSFNYTNVAQAVEELVTLGNHYWRAGVQPHGAGPLVRELVFRIDGRTAATSRLVFDLTRGQGGNILNYSWPEDGTRRVTKGFGLGTGDGPLAPYTSYDSGFYPLLEEVVHFGDDVFDQGDLDTINLRSVLPKIYRVVIPQVTVKIDTDEDANLSPNLIKPYDQARIKINDEFQNVDEIRRIVDWEMSIGEGNIESATFNFESATV